MTATVQNRPTLKQNISGQADAELLKQAYYAAAQAITAIELDFPFLTAFIESNGEVSGGVRLRGYPEAVDDAIAFAGEDQNNMSAPEAAFLEKRIRVSLAGPLGEMLLTGKLSLHSAQIEAISSGANAFNITGCRPGKHADKVRLRLLRRLVSETVSLLQRPEVWSRVELLAGKLLGFPEGQRKLSSRKIVSLIIEAEQSPKTEEIPIYDWGREFCECGADDGSVQDIEECEIHQLDKFTKEHRNLARFAVETAVDSKFLPPSRF